jgi:DNA-binding HxlR family transcriptional regulator
MKKKANNSKKTDCAVCPIAKTADLVGDHWTLLIIRDLLTGKKRFGDLEASLAGISSRTLTKKLETLVSNNLVVREEFSEKPPRVEYSLTSKGKDLHGISEAMRKYGEKHL